MLTLEQAGVVYEEMHDQEYVYGLVRETVDELRKKKPDQQGWDSYWSEHEAASDPSYLKRSSTFRYAGKFVTADSRAEALFSSALRGLLYKRFFGDVEAVAEFGCGSGSNLAQLRSVDHRIHRYGYDWSPAAVKLAASVATTAVFNMRQPDSNVVQIQQRKFGVLTHGAMEQLGDDFAQFLSFMKGLRASVYVHVEPIIELYDPASKFDRLAIDYHTKRGYLGNFLSVLRQDTQVDISECARTGFGNIFNEGYSVIVWGLK